MTRDQVAAEYDYIVVQTARALTGDPGLQDDLMQEGRLELLEAADSYDETRALTFAGYVRLRIRGRMMDSFRRGPERTLAENTPAKVVSIDTAIARREQRAQMTGAVEKLTPRQRQVIEMRVQGISQSEIGRRLGVSQEAARRLEQRAIGRMRKDVQSAA